MILGLFAPKADMVGTEQMSADPWALLPAASTNAQAIDSLYVFITVLCGLSMVGVVGAQVYFMWKYKKPKSGHRKTSPITHNGRLEFIWSAIPALFMVVLFAWGEIGFVEQFSPPPDASTYASRVKSGIGRSNTRATPAPCCRRRPRSRPRSSKSSSRPRGNGAMRSWSASPL